MPAAGIVFLMATAWLFGSSLLGIFQFGTFVFSTVGISVLFCLVFLGVIFAVIGPEYQDGEILAALRPKALDHLLRKHKRASRVSQSIAKDQPHPSHEERGEAHSEL
jgi:hypothetical protein